MHGCPPQSLRAVLPDFVSTLVNLASMYHIYMNRHASEVIFVGECDASKYPVAKGRIPLEKLRDIMTFRSRTNVIQAVFRVRNALARATHEFFQKNGFYYLHAPIITSHDCEGAGEMFGVTTMLQTADAAGKEPIPDANALTAAEEEVTAIGEVIREMKEQKKDKRKVKAEVAKLTEAKAQVDVIQRKMASPGGLPRDPASGACWSGCCKIRSGVERYSFCK